MPPAAAFLMDVENASLFGIADDIVVMRDARLVETGSVYDVFESPKSAYTRALLASIPRLGSMHGTDIPERFDLVEGGLQR